MRDLLDFHLWPQETLPPTTNVWVGIAGQMTGYGSSSYDWCWEYVCPHVIIAGHGTVRTPFGEYQVGPGDVFCLWPGLRFLYGEDPARPWQLYWLHLIGSGAQDFARLCGFAPPALCWRSRQPERVQQAFQQLFTYYSGTERSVPRALSLLYAVAEACRPGEKSHTEMRDLVAEAETLARSLIQTGINVNELTRALRISRNTLHQAFVTHRGITPGAFLQDLRLAVARELLLHTDWSLATIAHAAGYTSDKYFMRAFRQSMGCTPAAWRSASRYQ